MRVNPPPGGDTGGVDDHIIDARHPEATAVLDDSTGFELARGELDAYAPRPTVTGRERNELGARAVDVDLGRPGAWSAMIRRIRADIAHRVDGPSEATA